MANGISVGLTLIKRWEQCRLRAFIPIPNDPWTVGWGATGPGIDGSTRWTQEEADADLNNRVSILASQLRGAIKLVCTDNQLGAILSLAYNEGIHAIIESTLLKKFNVGDIKGAAEEFLRWNMAHGKIVKGLENRRRDERNVFLT